jgi:cell division topological specificity factor
VGLVNDCRSGGRSKGSAAVAKERLFIVVAHDRAMRDPSSYLPRLQQEIIAVIRKYGGW